MAYIGLLITVIQGFCDDRLTPVNPKSCTGIKNFPQAEISKLYSTNQKEFKRVLAKAVEENNNIGSALIPFKSGEKIVYRSSLLNKNKQCLKALTQEHNVLTIVNLYNGNFTDQETVTYQELQAFTKDGGETYIKFLNLNDIYHNKQEFELLQNKVTDVIKLIANTDGNVLIHCYGGMHRTGIVFGVIQKCIQKLPMQSIVNNYKKHVDWKSKQSPGVYRQENIDFIRQYNCQLLASF